MYVCSCVFGWPEGNVGDVSLLQPCGTEGSISDHQVWPQGPFPTVISLLITFCLQPFYPPPPPLLLLEREFSSTEENGPELTTKPILV